MKHVQPSSVTYSVMKTHLDNGRFSLFRKTQELAKAALGGTPVIVDMAVARELLSDGFHYDVVKITFKRSDKTK